ncbi:hypothetical protein DV737_g3192, partial [Chaetothyriales sp. CBS 132003]
MGSRFAATVIGAGPSGLAAVGNLLAQRVSPLLWVDPLFSSGRLNQSYREVPSNTKVKLFLDFAQAVKPFQDIIDTTPSPNPVTHLEQLDQNQHCTIADAADMCRMLTDGLLKRDDVTAVFGNVNAANWADGCWQLGTTHNSNSSHYSSHLLVLCTGSQPKSIKVPPPTSIKDIHLDIALTPTKLQTTISPSEPATIAVIGSSHSAVLALLNLYTLATSSHPELRIKWFSRSPLLYAVPKGDWILYDNTGLKGLAATWARSHLEDDSRQSGNTARYIEKVELPEGESFITSPALSRCTHVVQAIGYAPNPLPSLTLNHAPLPTSSLVHDAHSGAFSDNRHGHTVPGLYGAGIAWPETVTDPEGNVESAVGLYKFMKYLRRVVPEWTKTLN